MLNGVGDERIHRRHCFCMAGRREWRDSAAGGGGGAPWSRGFAPHSDVGLRPIPGKALFLRRGAQTLCREELPAAEGVCAPHPGKPYFTVEGRKPIARKSLRRCCEFAPHTRESLILPLRGANFMPGRASGDGVGLRLIPGKALFFRRGAQTF